MWELGWVAMQVTPVDELPYALPVLRRGLAYVLLSNFNSK